MWGVKQASYPHHMSHGLDLQLPGLIHGCSPSLFPILIPAKWTLLGSACPTHHSDLILHLGSSGVWEPQNFLQAFFATCSILWGQTGGEGNFLYVLL